MITGEYEKWLAQTGLDPAVRADLESVRGDSDAITERFDGALPFGTAGQRGIMRGGTNSMNIYTVGQTTQAIADLLLSENESAAKSGVVIAYDCRHNSELFSKLAASVFAANGITAYLFDGMRPTPELSYAVRKLGCAAGINITASHNTREYNGYKVYAHTGAQLPPHDAAKVAQIINKTDVFTGVKHTDYDMAVKNGDIKIIGGQIDEGFYAEALSLRLNAEEEKVCAKSLKIVYTPFHGAGYILVPEILRRAGFENVICQPLQMLPDGDFPTVKSPNPEESDGLRLAFETARRHGARLVIATDPDADRVAAAQLDENGKAFIFSGNQIGALLLDYIISMHKKHGTMPKNPFAVKSIVSTEMVRAIGKTHGVSIFDCFTGFKFIAEEIDSRQAGGDMHYLLGFEESIGYTMGDYCRDKDAVGSAMMIACMAAWYAGNGMTLLDGLTGLYEKYGAYREKTLNIVMDGADGRKRMALLMASLRESPPDMMAGIEIKALRDYKAGTIRDNDGNVKSMELSGSDVLYFELKDGGSFIVRPSGTEPKIKVYLMTNAKSTAEADEKLEKMAAAAGEILR